MRTVLLASKMRGQDCRSQGHVPPRSGPLAATPHVIAAGRGDARVVDALRIERAAGRCRGARARAAGSGVPRPHYRRRGADHLRLARPSRRTLRSALAPSTSPRARAMPVAPPAEVRAEYRFGASCSGRCRRSSACIGTSDGAFYGYGGFGVDINLDPESGADPECGGRLFRTRLGHQSRLVDGNSAAAPSLPGAWPTMSRHRRRGASHLECRPDQAQSGRAVDRAAVQRPAALTRLSPRRAVTAGGGISLGPAVLRRPALSRAALTAMAEAARSAAATPYSTSCATSGSSAPARSGPAPARDRATSPVAPAPAPGCGPHFRARRPAPRSAGSGRAARRPEPRRSIARRRSAHHAESQRRRDRQHGQHRRGP